AVGAPPRDRRRRAARLLRLAADHRRGDACQQHAFEFHAAIVLKALAPGRRVSLAPSMRTLLCSVPHSENRGGAASWRMSKPSPQMHTLSLALRACGGEAPLAKALGVS